jgi:oligoribonuclease
MEASPLNLFWCDMEFTDLDPARARILEVAVLVTTPELEPLPLPGGSREGWSCRVRITPEEAAAASDWVKANQAELLARCRDDPAALPLAEVERRLIEVLAATCGTPDAGGDDRAAERHRLPLLAGNSVHKDHSFLERWMPELARRLSYRLIDVSCLKELRRRWYPLVPAFDKEAMAQAWLPDLVLEGAEHDALYDVKCSLAELRYYREHLFRRPGAAP